MGLILPVTDGRLRFGCSLDDYHKQVAVKAARRGVLGLTMDVDDAAVVHAYVNHNRWIVDCPDCRAAVYIWLDAPAMLCSECWNASIGGKYRRVILPKDVAGIAAALMERPLPQNRNWRPGETVAMLRADNQQHGLGGA